MKKSHLYYLPLLFVLLFNACKKENSNPSNPSSEGGGSSVVLADVSGYPGTVLTIETSINLNEDVYSGEIDQNSIEIYKAGPDLSFSIPNIPAGNYQLNATIEGEDYSFNLEVLTPTTIADPVQYLTDYFVESDAADLEYDDFVDSLINEGIIDPVVAANDAAIWDNIESQAQTEYTNMTPAQQAELAALIEANRDWLDKLSYYAPNTHLGIRSYACEALRQQGLSETSLFKKMAIAVEYKLCQQTAWGDDAEIGSAPSKAVAIIEAPKNWYAINTLTDLIGKKIENLTKEIQSIGNSKHIAEDSDGMSERADLIFDNEVAKNIYARIHMRTPRASDAGAPGSLGNFAALFTEYSSSYNDFANQIDPNLEWRPTFGSGSKVVNFNHFMRVTNVDNPNVTLTQDQQDNGDWMVAFRTYETTQQTFNYTVDYSDGHQYFSKTYSAKLNPPANPLAWEQGLTPEEWDGWCYGCPGTIDGELLFGWTGGQAPYQVSIDGGSSWMLPGDYTGTPDPNETIFYKNDLIPDTYNVIVKDNLGAQITGIGTISW